MSDGGAGEEGEQLITAELAFLKPSTCIINQSQFVVVKNHFSRDRS